MRFTEDLQHGLLVRRYKRFLADVQFQTGETTTVHCANSGTMLGCDEPGSKVVVSRSKNPNRKLAYTWELVWVGSGWVGINTQRPNQIVAEAIQEEWIPELRGYVGIDREVPYGASSRIDLLLRGQRPCYVEVKNVTLARGDLALFPDAVTERGTKHLLELTRMVEEGNRAVMFYLVNRQDCQTMAPAWEIDPVYADTLAAAVEGGVEVLTYGCSISAEGIQVDRPLSFSFEPC